MLAISEKMRVQKKGGHLNRQKSFGGGGLLESSGLKKQTTFLSDGRQREVSNSIKSFAPKAQGGMSLVNLEVIKELANEANDRKGSGLSSGRRESPHNDTFENQLRKSNQAKDRWMRATSKLPFRRINATIINKQNKLMHIL